ncbi:iron complex transport system permease protein [Peribacillus deserti]|uniref:Iron complex transport system permease protein n=1 Tax=Peribacillus deserti TaxID=673318 RepID=A0ABS2QQB0_9BACI|nr:iron ABC transporter permease [Peribacillus deserti]MBM7694436.1 iron complex transport system permease protein [Peribacillus deserti]
MREKKYSSVRVLKGTVSFLIDRKALLTLITLGLTAVLLFLFSTGVGQMYISPWNVLKALTGAGSSFEETVIFSLRLPRILTALFVGIALAVAGGILQGMIRNPLASPDIIGLTNGASLAVVSFLAVFSDSDNSLTVSIGWLPAAAFLGASATAFIVYLLSWNNGMSPVRLVLIGIGISTLLQAGTTLMMILGPIYRASQANIWITGSVNGSKWMDVQILVPVVVVLVLAAITQARNINVQELGEDAAASAGSRIQVQRMIMLLVSTALTGTAVAFAGGIGFVGLMAPHIARRLVGGAYGALLPVAAVTGAILVLAADLIGRTLFAPLEIPAGVFTASIGAPYFIYLLYKTRNSQ